ncbi:type I secretion system outer membrane component LapE [Photobacterium aphoticum]|uniref:Type I secretion system outer membrane component LapE n=1 Tax=Photobacterium aphoticum TaxID=754436 RepID=A0A090R0N8_9GAMM|nr:type I secretion system outer membrane component LapE [Photobacterium aphoticum]
MKKQVLSLVIGALCVPTSWAMSLEEAVSQGLATSPEIKEVVASYNSRLALSDQAVADYLPSLDLSGEIGYQRREKDRDTYSTTEEMTGRQASLRLRQLIFDGFGVSSNIDRTESEAEAERYRILYSAENFALNVSNAYLNVLREQQLLELAEDNLKTHLKYQRDITKKVKSGLSSTADISQINGRVARAQANVLSARNNLNDVNDQFLRLVNAWPKDLVQPDVDDRFLPASLEEALTLAKENNPTVSSSVQDIDAAKSAYKASKSGYYPEIDVYVEQRLGEDYDGAKGSDDDFSAMVRLNYNLFGGGRDQAKVAESVARLDQAKSVSENTVRQVEEGTRLAWSAVEILNQQKVFYRQHVEQSFQTLKAYQRQFKLGTRSLLDVLNTENELFEARKSYVNTDYQHIDSQYRLLNATGNLLDALYVTTPEEWEKGE